MLIFFYADLFTCFGAWIRWCVLKTQTLQPVNNQKTFLLAILNPSFIDFKYIYVLEILSSWRLGSADAWPAWNKMLFMVMVCYMLNCIHLHHRYDKSDSDSFLLILFHHWAAFVVYQQTWVNCTTSNYLINISFVNHIQVGSFRGCSWIGVQKCSLPSLPKICHTYPTMMKLSAIIPYLTKIQNIFKLRDTPIKFCWHQYFFTKNHQL